MMLNQAALELEAYRSRIGRFPKDEKEVVKALHGKPMPCFYETLRSSIVKTAKTAIVWSVVFHTFMVMAGDGYSCIMVLRHRAGFMPFYSDAALQ